MNQLMKLMTGRTTAVTIWRLAAYEAAQVPTCSALNTQPTSAIPNLQAALTALKDAVAKLNPNEMRDVPYGHNESTKRSPAKTQTIVGKH